MYWHEIKMFAVETHHFCFDSSVTVAGFYYALRTNFGGDASRLDGKAYDARYTTKAFGARRELLCVQARELHRKVLLAAHCSNSSGCSSSLSSIFVESSCSTCSSCGSNSGFSSSESVTCGSSATSDSVVGSSDKAV